MIRITKPQPGPAVLLTKGVPARDAFCAAHDGGTRLFEPDRAIYAHDDVKAALIAAQHAKCAFCESKVTHVSSGDVEHYRPKAGFRQREDTPLEKPGYYWLSYDWDNLYFACEICNRRFKKNLFPLWAEQHRARTHADDITREKPLLLNPADDPEHHLTFRDEVAKSRNRSRRGSLTIQIVGLNRPEVLEQRLDRLNQLRYLVSSRATFSQLIRSSRKPKPELERLLAEVNQALDAATLATAPYSAMAKALLE